MRKEQERRERAKEIYENVLRGNLNDVILQEINEYIDEFTPDNPYGRHISERLPQEVERRLHGVDRTNAVDALFSRIAESSVSKSGGSVAERGRRIAEKKDELLTLWAKATGRWHTDIGDFTSRTEPIGSGKDSVVYLSDDGEHVIKVSHGKNEGQKFVSDIDNRGHVDGSHENFITFPFFSTSLVITLKVSFVLTLVFDVEYNQFYLCSLLKKQYLCSRLNVQFCNIIKFLCIQHYSLPLS